MRYFIEVAYDGFLFSGFQIQNNANTIQKEIELALHTILKRDISLTGSSRTDAKVNALQNYFHFDVEVEIPNRILYNLNAILPQQIVVKSIRKVIETAHSRFTAISRTYEYVIVNYKNPFLINKAYYFPFAIDNEKLIEAASLILSNSYFFHFSKTNTQVSTYNCKIMQSKWLFEKDKITYTVEANRFLRGMVKALVGTSLQFAINKLTKNNFEKLFKEEVVEQKANFTPPGYGLFLKEVKFSENIFL